MGKIWLGLTFIVILFVLTVVSPGFADDHRDFKEGVNAYRDKDYPKALRIWSTLAKKGHAQAQYNLGILYVQGAGVSKNPREAVKWIRKSAEQGFSNAQYHLGVMYLNGDGIKKNYKEAAKWLQMAAEQGDDLAQYGLSSLYVYGKGVPKDLVKAHFWSNLAAKQGNENAEKVRDEIARNMTPEQLINARLMAREWKPKKK